MREFLRLRLLPTRLVVARPRGCRGYRHKYGMSTSLGLLNMLHPCSRNLSHEAMGLCRFLGLVHSRKDICRGRGRLDRLWLGGKSISVCSKFENSQFNLLGGRFAGLGMLKERERERARRGPTNLYLQVVSLVD